MAGARILLVEDEGLIRMVTAELLQDEGFEVIEAFNGDEAASLLDGCAKFDALFTDVQMPGRLDGVDLAVCARRWHPALPVLVVSGYAEHLVRRLRILHPAAVLMVKPYLIDEVIAALRRLTGTE